MKPFDKAFSLSPFLHTPLYSHRIFSLYFNALCFLCLVSFILFGYTILSTLLVAYGTAFCIVWLFKFFENRLFFNSILWHNAVLTYVLLLPPAVDWYLVILGVVVMLGLGQGILSTNKRAIINPILLGVIVTLSFSWYNIQSNTLIVPILYPMVLEANTLLGNDTWWQALLDSYHIIAGNEEWSYLYTSYMESYEYVMKLYQEQSLIQEWTFQNTLFNFYNSWLGTNSLISLFLVYAFLSFKKVINFTYPLTYIAVYIISNIIFDSVFANETLDFTGIILYLTGGSLWFCAIFLVTDNFSAPVNKRGHLSFVISAALITALLNIYHYTAINHMIGLIIANVGASFLELINKPLVFGQEKITLLNKIKQSFKIEPFHKLHTRRILLGVTILITVYAMVHYIEDDTFIKREERYYYELIKDVLPQYLIEATENPIVYQATGEEGDEVLLVYSELHRYRIKISLIGIIKDNILEEIVLISVSGEYPNSVRKEWVQEFVGYNIDDLPDSLEEYLSQNTTRFHSSLLVALRSNIEAVLNIKKIAQDYKE